MLDLAKHIIETKRGEFDPAKFDDRYEAAVAELVKAKLAGKSIKRRAAPKPTKVVDLMAALRASVGQSAKPAAKRSSGRRLAAPQRKAG